MTALRPQSRIKLFFRILSLVLIITISASSLGPALSSGSEELTPVEVDFEIIELPPGADTLPVEQQTLPETQSPSGLDTTMAEVVQAAQVSTQSALETANRYNARVSGTRVQAHIATDSASFNEARRAISSAGGEVTGVAYEDTLIQAWLPVTAIEQLSKYDSIFYIQSPVPGTSLETDAVTEGLAVINGNAWHAAGITGTGVKIGVIDGGFEGYTALVGSDLPSNITVKNFVDGEDDLQVDGTSKHGTACAEIVHDIAPGAAMYLAKISTTVDLEEAANWLRNVHQVDVVSVSFGWRTETPGDGTGYLADLAQSMRSAGILWVQAAGNERDSHWGGTYRDSNQNNFHEFNTTGQEVNYFGPGDGNAYNIPAGYYIPVQMRWNDWTNVNQDYDLHVVRWNGSSWQIIGSSTNPQTGGAGQRPTEYAVGLSTGGDTAYGYIIERKNSTQNVNFEAYAIKVAPTDEVLHSRSIISMADAPAAFTVAALDVNSPYNQESYSSEGPTNGPGGAENGGFTKPDISGYANVTTVSYGSAGFNGTSSATPHVAGAAGLVYGAYPGYSPDQVQSFLEGRAIDKGTAGMDNLYGYGRLYLSDPPGPAADKIWNGNVSSDWHNANNWTPTGVPTSGQTVLIPDTARDPIVSSANAAAKDLTLNPGAALDLTTRMITVEGTVTNNGTLTQSKNVNVGSTTEFLRIKNQAGTQTKYYGLDISPDSISESFTARENQADSEPSFLDRVVGTVGAWLSGLFSPPDQPVALEAGNDIQGAQTEPQSGANTPDAGYHPGLVRPNFDASAETINLVINNETDPTPPSNAPRTVELKLESDPLVMPASGGQFTPEEPQAAVSLVLDDNNLESGYGVNSETNSYQFIWLNRFTPSPSEYPFILNEIRVMFADNGGTWGVSIGDAIDLVVYEDADGNPANGATWRATFNETIQAVNGSTWSVYTLSSPVTLNGPGDVLIGVIDRFVQSGVTAKTYPATFDTTSSQERSWIGWWNADPPNPATLPPDNTFNLMTGSSAGNWLIRGYGETSSLEGIHGTVTYNGSPAAGIYLVLRYYNGSSWSTWGSPVATDSNGEYLFSGMPDLGPGQVYYVRYENGANGNLDVTNYLSVWYSYQISSYVSGMYVSGGDFDITDIKSASPSPGATVTLPQTFTWTRRSATTDDSYSFNLYDPADGDPEFESPMLGYVDQYTLNNLPSGFNYDTEYAWYVKVYAPDDGYGYPYYARYVTFTDGGQPTVTPTATATSTSTSTPTQTTTTTVQPPTVTPTPTPTLTPPPGDTDLTVSISGNQHCSGRISGVDRCYEFDTQKSMTATVRFYFTEGERSGISKSELFAFHYQEGWEKQPGPYTSGGSGDGQYVEAQNLNKFSLYALDRESGGPYLPMTMKFAGAPPVPQLYDIQNPDGNGDYTVSWSGVTGANAYVLEEDDNNSFSSPTTVYDGNGTSKNITGKMIGTYYYRVKSVNDYKSSAWSQVKSVQVTVEPPLTCEQYDFGDSGVQYYIYSSGKTWNFTAQKTMTIESVETKSVLATARGLTFTIRVKINDVTIATWSQYVNNTTFNAYYHSANVTYQLNQGDKVTYFISAPAGSGEAAIAWYNYVKLCGR